jgi:hypothetical protein
MMPFFNVDLEKEYHNPLFWLENIFVEMTLKKK